MQEKGEAQVHLIAVPSTMNEQDPRCLFPVFKLCLTEDTVLEHAQAYCLLPDRGNDALAAVGRTARADVASDLGAMPRFAGRQRTGGPRRRSKRVVQRADVTRALGSSSSNGTRPPAWR
jgi:hypothetical protein